MISLVLPAHNEIGYLEDAVEAARERLGELGGFEIIIAEDGSTDGTGELAEELAERFEEVRYLGFEERLGRGEALERAFREAEGEYLLYMDVDLATDPVHLKELVERLRGGADVVTGSRYLEGSEAERSGRRRLFSRGFNGLSRWLLGSSLRDHQCGFKGFRREALERVLPEVEDRHWFWDTEVLVRAQRTGLRVEEFPVRWREVGDSKVDIWRDVVGMGSELGRLFWQTRVQPRITRRRALALSLALVAVALLLLGQYIDLGRVASEVGGAEPGLLVAAGLVYVVSWPLRGLRYRDILRRLGYEEGAGFLTGAVFISQTGNLVFPARAGDAVRAYVVKSRRKIPYPSGFASLAVERVFDLLTITAMASVVLLFMVVSGGATAETLLREVVGAEQSSGRTALKVAAGVAGAALLAFVAIVVTSRSDRSYVRGFVTRFSRDSYAMKAASVLERFAADVQMVTTDVRAFGRIGAVSVAIWVIDVATAALVLQAFRPGLAVGALAAVCLFAVSVGNLAKVLPLSPGGIGLYEGAFSIIVVALTPVSLPAALGAALVDHLIKNAVTIAGGAVAMLVLNVSLTRAVEAGREAGASEPLAGDGDS